MSRVPPELKKQASFKPLSIAIISHESCTLDAHQKHTYSFGILQFAGPIFEPQFNYLNHVATNIDDLSKRLSNPLYPGRL